MRIIGLDIHRVFAEAVAWENGKLRRIGRVDIRRDLLEKFACSLSPEDIVVVEAASGASVPSMRLGVMAVLTMAIAVAPLACPLSNSPDTFSCPLFERNRYENFICHPSLSQAPFGCHPCQRREALPDGTRQTSGKCHWVKVCRDR